MPEGVTDHGCWRIFREAEIGYLDCLGLETVKIQSITRESDQESYGMRRKMGIAVHHLESPGMKSPLRAGVLRLKFHCLTRACKE